MMSLPNRVLVVDDNQDMAKGTAMVLRELPAEVQVAHSADGACSEMKAGPCDLVVSDIVMPQMSGIELVERLKRSQPDLRVLLVSGQRSHPSLRDRELPAGAAFLAKPFTPAALSEKVRDVLDHR